MTLGTVTGRGFRVNDVFETADPITYYVETTGSDSNDGLTVPTALATIQEALNRIPMNIANPVRIYVGAGSFAGFSLHSYMFTNGLGELLIQGTLDAATLASGTASGTATAGDTHILTDGGQAWTAHDLRGRLCLVDGEYRVIRENDATSLEFGGALSGSCNGKTYAILDHATVINTIGEDDANILISGLGGNSNLAPAVLRNLQIETTGTVYGIAQRACVPARLQRCRHIGAGTSETGFQFTATFGSMYIEECYSEAGSRGLLLSGATSALIIGDHLIHRFFAYDANDVGVSVYGAMICQAGEVYADACGIGLHAVAVKYISIDTLYARGCGAASAVIIDSSAVFGDLEIDGDSTTANGLVTASSDIVVAGGNIEHCTGHGVVSGGAGVAGYWGAVAGGSLINASGTLVVDGNGGSGFYGYGGHTHIILTACTGTNGTYGVELEDGAWCRVSSATAVTGATGNATITDAKVLLTWVGDFASNLDSEIDATVGTVIKRRD